MKTHDLAKYLHQCAKLLRTLPNSDISDALATLTELAATSEFQEKVAQPRRNVAHSIPADIKNKLSRMTPEEIEGYLTSTPELAQASSLMTLASTLGIPTSKRQSHSSLVNMIIRHFEATQMELIIRRDKK